MRRQPSPPSSVYGSPSTAGSRWSSVSDSPSIGMKTMACCRVGRVTQIAEATDPVRGLTPCHRTAAGRRSRRLVIISRLHSSKPSFESVVTMSSRVATHPCSWAIHVILPRLRSSLRPSIASCPPAPAQKPRWHHHVPPKTSEPELEVTPEGSHLPGLLARADRHGEVNTLLPVR